MEETTVAASPEQDVSARAFRKSREGVVVSYKMDKTVVV